MRYFKSNTQETNLTASINGTVTSIAVASVANYPTVPFTLVIDPDLATQEIVEVTAIAGASNLTVTRNVEGTGIQSHDNGAKVRHMVTGRDLQEPQTHMAATAGVHGVTGDIVGTTQTQTLTNKSLTSPTITGSGAITAASLSLTTSATLPAATTIGSVSATELGYVDGVTSAIQTQLDGKQALDSDLTAIAGLSSAGIVTRTGDGTAAARTLTAGTGISVTNGDGVSGNPTVSATIYFSQVAPPTSKASSFTLTASECLNGIVVTNHSGTDISMTVPTGTNLETALPAGTANDTGFRWSLVNTGSRAVTFTTNTGHTYVGNATIALGVSASFITRKTATNTFVTYRVA
jgi:hypothetical protein